MKKGIGIPPNAVNHNVYELCLIMSYDNQLAIMFNQLSINATASENP
jgi:hypothetical protein